MDNFYTFERELVSGLDAGVAVAFAQRLLPAWIEIDPVEVACDVRQGQQPRVHHLEPQPGQVGQREHAEIAAGQPGQVGEIAQRLIAPRGPGVVVGMPLQME